MDGIVKSIKKYHGTRENFEALKKTLDGQKKIFSNNANNFVEGLNQLNATTYSLGYCYILEAKARTDWKQEDGKQDITFIQAALPLLTSGDTEQIRMAADKFSKICMKLAECLLRHPHLCYRGAFSLKTAVDKVSSNPNLLTPVHTAFVLICLKASLYDYALPVINTPILAIDPPSNSLNSLDFLSYFYYSGMIFTGLKQYANAIESFRTALRAPTVQPSIVQVECFKKMILVSLIADGTALTREQEEGISTPVMQKLKLICGVYVNLAVRLRQDPEAFSKLVEDSQRQMTEDNNIGLIKQLGAALRKRRIRGLTDTYVTVALNDMGLESASVAEDTLLGMIADGEIFARMDQKNGMVTFEDNPEEFKTRDMINSLDGRIREIISLNNQLQTIHQETVVSKRYVERTMPVSLKEEAESDPQLAAALAASRREH
jgi:COP9 signalosome complex subunit 3